MNTLALKILIDGGKAVDCLVMISLFTTKRITGITVPLAKLSDQTGSGICMAISDANIYKNDNSAINKNRQFRWSAAEPGIRCYRQFLALLCSPYLKYMDVFEIPLVVSLIL